MLNPEPGQPLGGENRPSRCIFDFERDIYGDLICIVLQSDLLERRFKSSNELRAQLITIHQCARRAVVSG